MERLALMDTLEEFAHCLFMDIFCRRGTSRLKRMACAFPWKGVFVVPRLDTGSPGSDLYKNVPWVRKLFSGSHWTKVRRGR